MVATLQHSPSEVVRKSLISVGVGSDPNNTPLTAWPVYATNEPQSPDSAITVYDTTGQDDGSSMTDGELYTHFGIQIRVRSASHSPGWVKADDVRKRIAQDIYNLSVSIGGTSYLIHCFSKISNVISLGKAPESKRSLFTINAMVVLKQV